MAKRHSPLKQTPGRSNAKPNVNALQRQIEPLLEQHKYRRALTEIKKNKGSMLTAEFTTLEAKVWSLRGQQELEQEAYKAAENSFRQALKLGLEAQTYYWIAKCLVARDHLDAALDLIQTAFKQEHLPKDDAICYLKLLILKGQTATVEQLLQQQPQRFTTAQKHWAQGVLALKANDPETALTAFSKIKRPVTPGDVVDAWLIYTHQTIGNWQIARTKLEPSTFFSKRGKRPQRHPILERLQLRQGVQDSDAPLLLKQAGKDRTDQDAIQVISLLHSLDEGNYHEAGHVLLNLGSRVSRFPELKQLRSALLTLAGQQSMSQGALECTATFWTSVLKEKPFNPQLAVNLNDVLDELDADKERQRLLIQLLNWLKQEGKRDPQAWPSDRLKPTLAHVHCLIADTEMALDRYRAGIGSLEQGERICPDSPEVIGRRGLIRIGDADYGQAVELLTKALEGGCRHTGVYRGLLTCLEQLDNPKAHDEVRRRFGNAFGDIDVMPQVKIAPWMEALATQQYGLFCMLVAQEESVAPPLQACALFIEAVQGIPTTGGRVGLNQTQARQAWDRLLQDVPIPEQVPVLQAITLSIQLYAKRAKGIAALIKHYLQQLDQLGQQSPVAREAYLVVLAVKETNADKVAKPVRAYLDTMPQPGSALAKIQLQVRRFTPKTAVLRGLIESALEREPQNPLLLLAMATTNLPHQPQYNHFLEQGFDLARRLQDAEALQAFREEEAFLHLREIHEVLPDPSIMDSLGVMDMDKILEQMIYKFAGDDISAAEMDELKQQLLEEMDILGGLEDEEDNDSNFNFFDEPLPPRRRAKKRKRDFRDL